MLLHRGRNEHRKQRGKESLRAITEKADAAKDRGTRGKGGREEGRKKGRKEGIEEARHAQKKGGMNEAERTSKKKAKRGREVCRQGRSKWTRQRRLKG